MRESPPALLLLLALVAACGGSPTAPTPSLPSGVLPVQSVSETYEFPEGWISTNVKQPDGTGFVHVPAGCLKVELLQINPGRGSILSDRLNAGVTTRVSVCAEAPDPKGEGYQFVYHVADEHGNQITPWLGTPGNKVKPGASAGDRAEMIVTIALPPVMPRLRVKVKTAHGFVLANKTIFMNQNYEIFVLAPLDWRY